MKNSTYVFIISVMAAMGYGAQGNQTNSVAGGQIKTEADLLDFYRQYSPFTDPGGYVYLYDSLPDSLPELCRLVRSQFIHPYIELPKYRDRIPQERWDESLKYPTVQSVLQGLLSYDSRGLVKDRKPEHRLVLGCRDYALLLASVLKHRGIPARLRCGHATYIAPEFHISHTICEVWNESDQRWILVDPDAGLIDFSRDKFDFSNDAWLQMQKKEIDPGLYGIPGRYAGLVSIVAKVCHDLASLLGTEYPINQYAPVLDDAFAKDNPLTAADIETLNRISELMKSLDARNLKRLQDIYSNTPRIQITRSFDPQAIEAESGANTQNTSRNKPNIEFIDILGGTFTMGSPSSEQGRKDDETQHQVTLSPFKISKYCITFEQFDQFCAATGRRKPRGFKRGNLPVSQVTWHDAAAFADWMECRLPTEAQWEYAARAHTTTPFYTGNSITTDQANFNGKKPYINGEKGQSRGKALPVGSFPANAFGLYDVHGNIWEWCSDWYGPYDINDAANPQGPETGKQKVIRGGGWLESAAECRSAHRSSVYPGNRGAGMGFRIVKSE